MAWMIPHCPTGHNLTSALKAPSDPRRSTARIPMRKSTGFNLERSRSRHLVGSPFQDSPVPSRTRQPERNGRLAKNPLQPRDLGINDAAQWTPICTKEKSTAVSGTSPFTTVPWGGNRVFPSENAKTFNTSKSYWNLGPEWESSSDFRSNRSFCLG